MIKYLVAVFLLLTLPAIAADMKISQLPAANVLTGVEAFPCVQSGVTDKCTVTQAVTFTYSLLNGDCVSTSGGAITCTKTGGVSFGALATASTVSLATQVSGVLPVANGGSGSASPSLIAGTNITITGTWPSQTINASGGGGGVTSVGETFTGGIISVAGSPITTSGTFALTVTGTSGGIPYFSSSTGWASSAALTSNSIVLGGGAGSAPTVLGSLGTTNTVLHGNVAGAPSFAAVALATDVSGLLPIANGGTGTASPGATAGIGITLGGSWPAQSIALTVPVTIANGGSGQTTAAAAFNALSPMTTIGDIIYGGTSGTGTRLANGTTGQVLSANTGAAPSWISVGVGTVTSVGWTGGIVSVGTPTSTPAFTIAGTSGGIPYFSSSSAWASSGALTASAIVLGGGAGLAPAPLGSLGTTTTVLHGNAAGAPSFGAVSLTADVANVLPVANGGTGMSNASPTGDYSTGRFYLPFGMVPSTATGAMNASKIVCLPGRILQKLTISALAVNIVGASAGGNIQIGLYSSSGGLPGAKIDSTASISTTSTGVQSGNLGSPRQVGPGGTDGDQVLWWCVNADNATVTQTPGTIIPGVQDGIVGSASAANLFSAASNIGGILCSTTNCNGGSSTFGTWPSTLAGSTWTDVITRVTTIVTFQPSSIP